MEVSQTKPNSSGLSLLFRMLFWDMKVHNSLPDAHYFLQILIPSLSTKLKSWTFNNKTQNPEPLKEQCSSQVDPITEIELCSGEIKMVMDKLGIFCNIEDGFYNKEEFSTLFEVEPSLEELKEAFDVFDLNRDGFIDAIELQRVLCNLGLKEGSNVEKCRRMICSVDDNGDGVVDFDEFVKFMEKFFC